MNGDIVNDHLRSLVSMTTMMGPNSVTIHGMKNDMATSQDLCVEYKLKGRKETLISANFFYPFLACENKAKLWPIRAPRCLGMNECFRYMNVMNE